MTQAWEDDALRALACIYDLDGAALHLRAYAAEHPSEPAIQDLLSAIGALTSHIHNRLASLDIDDAHRPCLRCVLQHFIRIIHLLPRDNRAKTAIVDIAPVEALVVQLYDAMKNRRTDNEQE